MVYAGFELGRSFLVRAHYDSNLVQFVTELAKKKEIKVASFTAIGALKRAKLGFFDQDRREYQEILLDSPQEIGSCIGNISIKEGEPSVHAHIVLADKKGDIKAGHLVEGIVFAAEVHLLELKGARHERIYDKTTGLSLWET